MINFLKRKKEFGIVFLSALLVCFILLFSQNKSYELFLNNNSGLSYTLYSFCLSIPINEQGIAPAPDFTKIISILVYLNVAFSPMILRLGGALEGYYKFVFHKSSTLLSFAKFKLYFLLKIFFVSAAIVTITAVANYFILFIPLASFGKEAGFLINLFMYFLVLFTIAQGLAKSRRSILLIFELGALVFIAGNLITINSAILPVLFIVVIAGFFLVTANSKGEI